MLIGSTVEAIERELVLQTLARCHGNRTHAARVLGLSVRTMRNKIRQMRLDGVDISAAQLGRAERRLGKATPPSVPTQCELVGTALTRLCPPYGLCTDLLAAQAQILCKGLRPIGTTGKSPKTCPALRAKIFRLTQQGNQPR